MNYNFPLWIIILEKIGNPLLKILVTPVLRNLQKWFKKSYFWSTSFTNKSQLKNQIKVSHRVKYHRKNPQKVPTKNQNCPSVMLKAIFKSKEAFYFPQKFIRHFLQGEHFLFEWHTWEHLFIFAPLAFIHFYTIWH